MSNVSPAVHLISRPSVDYDAVETMLEPYGEEAANWWESRRPNMVFDEEIWQSDTEALIELAGRNCYLSFAPGINPNVTKVREDQGEYLANIIHSGHGSVTEFGFFVFVFDNVSRVFTAELNRHRAGTAIAERSMRYVRLEDYDMVLPEAMDKYDDDIKHINSQISDLLAKITEDENLDEPGNFTHKKKVTSAMRRMAPMGVATSTVWGANVRTLRHVIELRTALSAEGEIRKVFKDVGQIMKEECPALFADFELNEDDEWVSSQRKV